MNRCINILFVWLLLALPSQIQAEPKSLKVASFDMEPYISGTVESGYFRNIVDLIFKRLQIDLTYEFVPHLRAPNLVENGSLHVLAPAFKQGQGLKNLLYSDPILWSDFGFVSSQKKSPTKKTLGLKSDRIVDYLKAQLSSKVIVQQLDMLNAGRIDGLYAEKYLTAEVIANKRPAFIQKFHFQADPLNKLEFRIAINKSVPQAQKILADFNRVLNEMQKSKELDSILESQGYFLPPHEKDVLNVGGVSGTAIELVREMSHHFLASHPKVSIKWNFHPETILREQLIRSLAFKSPSMDVVTLLGFDPLVYAARGWTQPFKNLPKSWDFDDLYASPTFSCTYQKEIVALPLSYDIGVTFYRKDVFEKKQISIKKNPSYREIEAIASKLHKPEKGFYGLCMLGKMNGGDNLSLFYNMGISNHASWPSEGRPAQFHDKSWIESLDTYKRLLHDYGPPNPQTFDEEGIRKLFAAGKCAILIGPSSSLTMFQDWSKSQVVNKFATVDLPYIKTPVRDWFWLWSLAVPKNSGNAELAQEFVAWATSADFAKLVAERKGWRFVPQTLRASIEANPEFQKADPSARKISDSLNLGQFSKTEKHSLDVLRMVDLSEVWPAISKGAGRYIQQAIEHKISTQEAMESFQAHARRVMYQSGIYSQKDGIKSR